MVYLAKASLLYHEEAAAKNSCQLIHHGQNEQKVILLQSDVVSCGSVLAMVGFLTHRCFWKSYNLEARSVRF